MATEKLVNTTLTSGPPPSSGTQSLKANNNSSDQVNGAHAQIEELRLRLEALEHERPSEEQLAQKHHKHWYPWMALVVVMNFFLWFAMIYAIFDASNYSKHRSSYLAYTWVIFIIPFIIAAFFLLSPRPLPLKRTRRAFMSRVPSDRPLKIINMLNALACFTFVIVYLYYSGIPTYNQPVWQTGIDFSTALPIPAIALLIPLGPGDSGNTQNGASLQPVRSSNGTYATATAIYNKTEVPFPQSAISIYNLSNQYTAIVFNSSQLEIHDFSTIQDRLTISMDLSYNSSTLDSTAALQDIESATQMNFEMFDPRLSLQTVFDCELAKYPLMSALANNNFLISVEYLTDRYGLVISPSATLKCGAEYHKILSQEEPRYAAYSWALESHQAAAANLTQSCDVAVNPNNRCRSTLSISFASHLVRSTVSAPGKSHLDIWLNAGAITGTIQFFAWFVEILVS